MTLKLKDTLLTCHEVVSGKCMLPEPFTLYQESRDTVTPEGGRVAGQGKPQFLLLQNPSQSQLSGVHELQSDKELSSVRDSLHLGSGSLTVLSSCRWHLRRDDFFSIKKKNAILVAPGRGLFWGVFFYASPSRSFHFHLSFEPQGCIRRGLLQTSARRIFSPAPLSCASKLLWMFQALPEIARAARHLFIIKWAMIVAWIWVAVVDVSEMTESRCILKTEQPGFDDR